MDLTVREALQLDELKNAEVLAGRDALDRVIRYVDSLEDPLSDIQVRLRADQILVTSAYLLRDDTKALEDLVEALAAVGAAGLLIKSTRLISGISRSVVDKANQLRLPIIEVPKEVPMIDVTHSILKEIFGRQSRFLEYSNEVRHAFTIVELEGIGLNSLASTIARLIGNDVAITDSRFNVLAWSRPDSMTIDDDPKPGWLKLFDENKETIGNLVSTFGRIGPESCIDIACLARPIIVKGKTLGYLIVHEDLCPLGEMELIALEHASTTVALEMTKQEALTEIQRRMEVDFFDDLLMDNIRSPEIANQRVMALGFPVGLPAAVLAVSIDDFDSLAQMGYGTTAIQEIRDRLGETIRNLAARRNPRPVVVSRSDSVISILPLPSLSACSSEGLGFAGEIMSDVKRKMPSISVSAGLSYGHNESMELSSAYKEAMTALEIIRATEGKGSRGFIGDLEAYRFLYEHPDHRYLAQMISASLKPILDYDKVNNTELYKTLSVVLTRAKSNDEAANKLHIHRNTLTNRMRQIKQLLSVDLEDPEQSFRLGLAVRARSLFRDLPLP